MNTLKDYISDYLEFCKYRKRLNNKTLKAYKIDLSQYHAYAASLQNDLAKDTVDQFITYLHKHYKPRTAKRKVASLKAFFHYLEYKELLPDNPFNKLDIRYIQRMLGHSSISTTEIYTHVSNRKQKDILVHKHPRNLMEVNKG